MPRQHVEFGKVGLISSGKHNVIERKDVVVEMQHDLAVAVRVGSDHKPI